MKKPIEIYEDFMDKQAENKQVEAILVKLNESTDGYHVERILSNLIRLLVKKKVISLKDFE